MEGMLRDDGTSEGFIRVCVMCVMCVCACVRCTLAGYGELLQKRPGCDMCGGAPPGA
jgi:hypothetical protein